MPFDAHRIRNRSAFVFNSIWGKAFGVSILVGAATFVSTVLIESTFLVSISFFNSFGASGYYATGLGASITGFVTFVSNLVMVCFYSGTCTYY